MSAQLLTPTCHAVLDLLPRTGCDWTPGQTLGWVLRTVKTHALALRMPAAQWGSKAGM